jgi:hypothetical protein
VYCPGYDAAPRNCPSSDYKSSADYTKCVCKAGFYEQPGECVPCPAGHWCLEGVKTPCPLHTYQSATGATACLACSSTGDKDGIFSGCPPSMQRKWCLPGSSQPECVPCTRCRKAYLTRTGPDEQVECYKGY